MQTSSDPTPPGVIPGRPVREPGIPPGPEGDPKRSDPSPSEPPEPMQNPPAPPPQIDDPPAPPGSSPPIIARGAGATHGATPAGA